MSMMHHTAAGSKALCAGSIAACMEVLQATAWSGKGAAVLVPAVVLVLEHAAKQHCSCISSQVTCLPLQGTVRLAIFWWPAMSPLMSSGSFWQHMVPMQRQS